MYNAFKSLLKMKKIFVIAVLQLALGISLLNYTGSIIDLSKNKVEKFTSLFEFDKTYLSRPISNRSREEGPDYSKLPNILNKLDEMKNNNIITSYTSYYCIPPTIPSIVERICEVPVEYLEGEQLLEYPSIIMSSDILKHNDLKVVDGRSLTENDFGKDYTKGNIPILLGNDYLGKVSIGETFTGKNQDITTGELSIVTFEVIGILDSNQLPTIFTKSSLISKISFVDSIIIIPTVDNAFLFSYEVSLSDFGLYVTLKDNSLLNKFTEEFGQVCSTNNYSPSIIDLRDDLENTLGNLNRELYQSIILGVVLTFLSIVGIISVMLGNLNRRYKEFGIKISQGASLKVICREVFYEIIITVVFSILLSFIILFFRKASTNYNLDMLIRNLLFCGFISIVIFIPIILKLKKLNIVDLVRGK